MIDAKRLFGLLLAMALLSGPVPGSAEEGSALLFEMGQLGDLEPGDRLAYRHMRQVPAESRVLPVDGEVTVTLEEVDGGRAAIVRLDPISADNRPPRRLDPFPAGAGNPVFLTFLESSLRAMAKVTGGSIFYLRNRMKEAFRESVQSQPATVTFGGREVEAEVVAYRPLEGDRNAALMGAFEQVELRFTLSPDVPGRFLSLVAETGPEADAIFREEMMLVTEEN